MELQQIRYFLAICEHGGFSQAAKTCGVSQPALTLAIKKLESEIGAELFHREGRRLVLSALGRMIKPHLERTLNSTQMACEIAINYHLLRNAPLRVGVMPTIGPLRLARFFAWFRKNNSGVELAVSEAGLPALLSKLENGSLDVAIMSSPQSIPDMYRTEPLYREGYAVVFPQGHRLEQLSAVRLADVSGEDYVDRLACEFRELVMTACAEHSVEIYAKFRSEREDWIQSMVLAGLGFAFMPRYSITLPGLMARPLIEPAVERTVLIVDMRGRQRSPAAQFFVKGILAYPWDGSSDT